MKPPRSTVLAIVLLASAVAGGCLRMPTEEAGGKTSDTDTEIQIRQVVTPENPGLTSIPVTEETSSVKLDVSLTNLLRANDPDARDVTVNVLVTLGYGEQIYNETFTLPPTNGTRDRPDAGDDTASTDTPYAEVIAETFERDVIDKVLESERDPFINVRVTTSAGKVSFDGYLHANPYL